MTRMTLEEQYQYAMKSGKLTPEIQKLLKAGMERRIPKQEGKADAVPNNH